MNVLKKLPDSKTLNRGVLFATAGLLVVLAFANIAGFFNDGFTCGTVNTIEEKRAKTVETINRQLNAAYGIFGIVLANIKWAGMKIFICLKIRILMKTTHT